MKNNKAIIIGCVCLTSLAISAHRAAAKGRARISEANLVGFWFQLDRPKHPEIWTLFPGGRLAQSDAITAAQGQYQLRGQSLWIALQGADGVMRSRWYRIRLTHGIKRIRNRRTRLPLLLLRPKSGRTIRLYRLDTRGGAALRGAYCAIQTSGFMGSSSIKSHRLTFNGAGVALRRTDGSVSFSDRDRRRGWLTTGFAARTAPNHLAVYADIGHIVVLLGANAKWGGNLAIQSRAPSGRVISFRFEGRYYNQKICRLRP